MLSVNSLFKCPVCSKELKQDEKHYFCKNDHSFDIAKKGYVNLLLPKDKGSGDPGDKKEMIISRREFLSKGFYEKFSDSINTALIDALLSKIRVNKMKYINILDAGCGEGYYTWRLKNCLSVLGYKEKINMYGIDVSKSAIHSASGGDKSIRFAVASTYHLPILSNCMDFIICLFAPRDEEAFHRVLKESGILIVAAPGSRHLLGLKKALYKETDVIGQKGTVGEGFHLINQINVSYNVHLVNSLDILNLWMMTPYSRHTDENNIENLKKLDELETEIDINIMVYQKL